MPALPSTRESARYPVSRRDTNAERITVITRYICPCIASNPLTLRVCKAFQAHSTYFRLRSDMNVPQNHAAKKPS